MNAGKLLLLIPLIFLKTELIAQTLDEIIHKHIESIGGYEKIKNIKSLAFEGVIKAENYERSFKSLIIHDSAIRTENWKNGELDIGIVTKNEGWTITFNNNQQTVKRKPKQEIKESQNTLNLHGLLIDYKQNGTTVKYLGKEKINGNLYYKLRLKKIDKTVITLFLDTSNFLIIRTITQPPQSYKKTSTIDYSYQQFQGSYLFVSKYTYIESGTETSCINYEVNPEIDRSLFSPNN